MYGERLAETADLDFIRAEGEALKGIVAPWFGTFFWVFGALSLVLVALGVLDYVSRLTADVLKTVYLQQSQRWTESRIYFLLVWGMIAVGSVILLTISDQPLVLLVLAACLNGLVMIVYSALLIVLNRRALPDAIKVKGFRLGMLFLAVAFYGFFGGWYILDRIQFLLSGG